MLRWLLILLGGGLSLVVLVSMLGPFLISPRPLPDLAPAADLALPESRFLTLPHEGTDGLEIHYLERKGDSAEGPVLVLLHGFTFNAFTWDPMMGMLDGPRQILAYDQVPYGLSAKPVRGEWSGPNPFTQTAAVAHLFALLDAKGVEQAILVGNSSGATLALKAALNRPERVSGLVLINPWVYVDRPSVPALITHWPQVQRLNLLLARRLGGSGTLLDLSYHDPAQITDERRALTTLHTRMHHWDLAWGELFVRAMASPVHISDHLAHIRQPALVIIGEEDRVVSPEDSRRAAGTLPNATLVAVPECGHVPQEECPEAVSVAINRWLDIR
ncbi:Pimeloyl-ACP methyl ester carboxylesterase [Ectothiorhodospira magna]|uniref:Pimeloyl-ACP methyl ester carboxylesterase n=1 Tax=Ectothiorhodospira magna TaxID=867345 RepID=A0A1H9CTB6_9GAMM|nr:alpha/beta hydrolase [Ectothiorhodospira magna]SEQ04327.1 Pimeloyl-ACP methyl ester carboxylesterase [Ectothiorhodospira magna]